MEPESMRKLFLANLDVSFTKEDLQSYFSKYGEIEELVIGKFKSRSSGWGFIKFTTLESVDNILKSRPHIVKNIKVDPKRVLCEDQVNGSADILKVNFLIVHDIPSETKEDDLQNTFSTVVGKSSSVMIVTCSVGTCAFLEYGDSDTVDKAMLIDTVKVKNQKVEISKICKEDMIKALTQGDLTEVASVRVGETCTKVRSSEHLEKLIKKIPRSPVVHVKKKKELLIPELFVGNLSYDTTENELNEYFSQYGEIIRSVIVRDPSSNDSLGFGFLEFSKSNMVDAVLKKKPHRLKNHYLATRRPRQSDHLGQPESRIKMIEFQKENVSDNGVSEFDPFGDYIDCKDFIHRYGPAGRCPMKIEGAGQPVLPPLQIDPVVIMPTMSIED
ncbi:unnamed protein product [Meganyctiphanes norvegica]|uniref:RRM domain-containing protein n=1 Tax=Meganyctiphanes norvegica TaxID=48144 RepID=A0AAV2QWF4_MEGNR